MPQFPQPGQQPQSWPHPYEALHPYFWQETRQPFGQPTKDLVALASLPMAAATSAPLKP